MKLNFFKNLLLLPLLLIGSNIQAQNFYTSTEYGIMFGASQYFGDLNPNYGFKYTRPAGGIFVRQYFNPYISVRGSINYAKLGYDDRFSSNAYQLQRNLSFRSDVVEAAVMAEFNFFWFTTGDPKRRYTPYLAGGVAAIYHSPYTMYGGRRYDLRSLGTEGQNTAEFADRKYSNVAVAIPLGAGIKYWIRPGLNLGFEIINRFTLTDYLDDVSQTYVGADKFGADPSRPTVAQALQDRSPIIDGQKLGRAGKQRGDTASKDQYLMVQFTLSLQLKTYKCPSHLEGMWEAY